MAAKGSEGVAAGTAPSSSLPAAQEAKYSEVGIIGGGTGAEEEEEIPDFVARFASLQDREERLTLIADELRRMEEKRGSAAPTYVELAAFVLLRDSATAALDGLPTCLAPIFDDN
ncbi:hypothetical protein ZWY2020_013281 [Hordeum vulgare]|nr:hypothetical protein ZWY2020_013281 [Hordeum vulgare]